MLYAQETYLNATEGYRFGESDVQETRFETPGELFRFCLKEHGRCVSKVYIDGPNGEAQHVGWVFLKAEQYEDTKQPYLKETWVTLYEKPDTVVRTRHYKVISR